MPIWMIVVEWLARLILVLLIGLSIWSIAIIIERRKYFKQLTEQSGEQEALRHLQSPGELKTWVESHSGLVAGTLKSLQDIDSIEKIDRSVSSYLSGQKAEMEKGLVVLGTLGSTTPFIGLLGTVLGIIVAFGSLSLGQIDSKQIMYILAEALILTAAGLTVAIPAVIAFNVFNKQIRSHLASCERIKNLFIARGKIDGL